MPGCDPPGHVLLGCDPPGHVLLGCDPLGHPLGQVPFERALSGRKLPGRIWRLKSGRKLLRFAMTIVGAQLALDNREEKITFVRNAFLRRQRRQLPRFLPMHTQHAVQKRRRSVIRGKIGRVREAMRCNVFPRCPDELIDAEMRCGTVCGANAL